jgi:hypothetical protein
VITEGQLLGEVIIDDFAVTGQRDTVFEIEIQQICCISDGLKLAGVLQIVSQKKMRFWGYRTPNFWCLSISSNEIPYLASILGFAGTREILARYSPRAERPLSFHSRVSVSETHTL